MRVVRAPLVCAIVAVFLFSLTVPVVAEVPDHDEDIYTWKHEDGPTSATGCGFVSPNGPTDENAAENSPCEILSYEIGNTNTHVFFRWTLATLEFGDTVPLDAYVDYYQAFLATAEENRRIDINIRADADDIWVQPRESQNDMDENLVSVEIIGDRSDGVFVVALPLDEIDFKFERGLVAGESFNVSANPKAAADVDLPLICFHASTAEVFCGEDSTSGMSDEANRTYTLQPYLDLQPEPAVYYENATGIPLKIEVVHDEPTTRTPWISHTYVYNWTLDSPAVDIQYDAVVDEGTADVSFSDPFDDILFDFLGAGSDEGSYVGLPAGVYMIEVQVEKFVGSLTLDFLEGELPDGENPGGNGGGGDGGGGDGGGSDDGGDDLGDSEESPAPAAVLLVTLLLTGLVSLRRLRRSS